MARRAVVKAFEPKTFTVSGAVYDDALADFAVQPISKKKRGFGVQYSYLIDTAAEYSSLIDHMALKAADLADEIGGGHDRVQGIYDQMEHI